MKSSSSVSLLGREDWENLDKRICCCQEKKMVDALEVINDWLEIMKLGKRCRDQDHNLFEPESHRRTYDPQLVVEHHLVLVA